jgi:RsmE family RNA methyltransferase
MNLNRFFVLLDSIKDNQIFLPKEQSMQIAKVLRLKTKDQIIILDNLGFEYLVELNTINPHLVQGIILEKKQNKTEPTKQVTIYQALLPREKFEMVLQKGTET